MSRTRHLASLGWLLVLLACDGGSAEPMREAPSPAEPPPAPLRACVAGVHAPEGELCLARAEGRGLLLFAHGLFFGDGEVDTRDRVIERARARGVSVLAVQGRRGLCDWSEEVRQATCWPIEPRQERELAALARTWATAIERAGVPGPRLLLGYSNGAFAAARLATSTTLLPSVDSFAIVSGGLHGDIDPNARPRRLLLIAGADDPHHRASMQTFDHDLSEAAISHELRIREGGHALADDDIDAALELIAPEY